MSAGAADVDPLAVALLAGVELLAPLPPAQARRVDADRVDRWTRGAALPVAEVRQDVVAGVPVRIVTPPGGGPFPTVVHCHGGGWVVGSPRTYDLPVRRLATDCRCRVVDVDYRLAPEHPFPAGLDDCWAVVSALPGPVAVAGDSGGAAIASAVTLRAREAGLALSAQLLVYPSVSLVRAFPSWRERRSGGGLEPRDSAWFADCWAPPGVDRADPLVSPYEAGSLAGLPPAVVAVGECDPLRDGGLAYAQRLQEAGVAVTTVLARGQTHLYLHMPSVPGAVAAVAETHAAFAALLPR